MSCKAASWELCWKKVGDFTIYAKTSKQNCCLKNIERRDKSTTQGKSSTIKTIITRNIYK